MLFTLYLQVTMLEASEGQKAAAIEQLKKARLYTWYPRLRSLLAASGESVIAAVLKEVDKSEIPISTSQVSGTVRKVAQGWTAVLSQATQFSRIARGGRSLSEVASVDASEIFAIRNSLPSGLAIIEYVISDNATYALVATKSSASCWELPVSSKQIYSNVDSLRKALSELEGKITAGNRVAPVKDWHSSELRPIMGPLQDIDKMLMSPLRSDILFIAPKITNLVFILPDELVGLPFHALPRSGQDKTRFLIQDYTVSYLSPGMLGSLVRPKIAPLVANKGKVAVFADSTGTLRGAKSETNTIKNIYKNSCNLYSGTNITKSQFVNAASSSNVVHVASHHKLDPNPLQFSLVLAGKPGGTGTVQLADLMRIRNSSLELAVLAACESISTTDTGLAGAPFTAEIFSLAGFPSVIGGLWKVSDEASSALMIDFYKRLSSLGQKGISLQRAQVYMIESKDGKFAHPFYWASFALYGDPR
jgi:CHAT domain-containing protein